MSVRRRARSEHLRRDDPVTDDTSGVAPGTRPPPLRSVAPTRKIVATTVEVWAESDGATELAAKGHGTLVASRCPRLFGKMAASFAAKTGNGTIWQVSIGSENSLVGKLCQ